MTTGRELGGSGFDPWPGQTFDPRLALISHLMMSFSAREIFKLISHEKIFKNDQIKIMVG